MARGKRARLRAARAQNVPAPVRRRVLVTPGYQPGPPIKLRPITATPPFLTNVPRTLGYAAFIPNQKLEVNGKPMGRGDVVSEPGPLTEDGTPCILSEDDQAQPNVYFGRVTQKRRGAAALLTTLFALAGPMYDVSIISNMYKPPENNVATQEPEKGEAMIRFTQTGEPVLELRATISTSEYRPKKTHMEADPEIANRQSHFGTLEGTVIPAPHRIIR